jgi:hypothetical protein
VHGRAGTDLVFPSTTGTLLDGDNIQDGELAPATQGGGSGRP